MIVHTCSDCSDFSGCPRCWATHSCPSCSSWDSSCMKRAEGDFPPSACRHLVSFWPCRRWAIQLHRHGVYIQLTLQWSPGGCLVLPYGTPEGASWHKGMGDFTLFGGVAIEHKTLKGVQRRHYSIPKLLRSIIGINELINTYYRPSNIGNNAFIITVIMSSLLR